MTGRSPDLAEIAARLPRESLPPVHLWHPERSGTVDIRIARDGTWYHEGAPIRRDAMVRLFSTVLRREPDGSYCLVTPVEKLAITVEDAPFVAVGMTAHGSGREQVLEFRTNVGGALIAGPEHPIRVAVDADSGEPSPYVLVRDGLEALIARAVYYDLVERAEETERDGVIELGVWSAGAYFRLGDGEAA